MLVYLIIGAGAGPLGVLGVSLRLLGGNLVITVGVVGVVGEVNTTEMFPAVPAGATGELAVRTFRFEGVSFSAVITTGVDFGFAPLPKRTFSSADTLD